MNNSNPNKNEKHWRKAMETKLYELYDHEIMDVGLDRLNTDRQAICKN